MSKQPTAIIHGTEREIMAPFLTDAQVASGVFIHTTVTHSIIMESLKPGASGELKVALGLPQIARDRILHLSQQLETALVHLAAVNKILDNMDCGPGPDQEATDFLNQERTSPSEEPNVEKRL